MGEFGWSCQWYALRVERLTAGERRRERTGGDRAEGGALGEAGCYATDKHGDGEVGGCGEWRGCYFGNCVYTKAQSRLRYRESLPIIRAGQKS